MIAPRSTKKLKKTAHPYLSQFWLNFKSKMAKIAKMTLKIQWMIQKNLYWENILKILEDFFKKSQVRNSHYLLSSKMAKIAKTTLKIQWMIQKILYWENFLKMFQNGPIHKVITIKVIFEDFLIFSPSCTSSWLDTEKFFKIFFQKILCSFWCIPLT